MFSWFNFGKAFKGRYLLAADHEEPYNEEFSVKALLSDEASSTSTELPPYRPRQKQASSCVQVFAALNVVLFVVSTYFLIISGAKISLMDRFGNSLLRKIGGPCRPIVPTKYEILTLESTDPRPDPRRHQDGYPQRLICRP
jgi:hypothetical protein